LISTLQSPGIGVFLNHSEKRRIYPGDDFEKILPDWRRQLQDIFYRKPAGLSGAKGKKERQDILGLTELFFDGNEVDHIAPHALRVL
jgi:hypothetical protein